MMRWPVYIYYAGMICCFIASLSYLKELKVRLLAILLFFSILVEVLAEIIGVRGTDHFFLYHYYNIIEYTFVTWILATILPPNLQQLKKWALWSCAIYAFLVFWIIFAWEGLAKFPSIGTNVESVTIIVWCLIAFLKLEPSDDIPIHRRSDFWFALAFFVYFTGTLCFNSIYNTLLANGKHFAELLYTLINSLFNYFLYTFLLIAIKCTRTEKKYSAR